MVAIDCDLRVASINYIKSNNNIHELTSITNLRSEYPIFDILCNHVNFENMIGYDDTVIINSKIKSILNSIESGGIPTWLYEHCVHLVEAFILLREDIIVSEFGMGSIKYFKDDQFGKQLIYYKAKIRQAIPYILY